MKRVLPLLLFVLLAFAGCQPQGPVFYQMTDNPKEVIVNAEKFVKQTAKKSKKYSAEDWQVAVDQFVAMSKNFIEYRNGLTEDELARFDAARLQFMQSVMDNGNPELAAQIKEAYAKIAD